MNCRNDRRAAWWLPAILVLAVGCGADPGPRRERVYGEVSLDDKLLTSGRIRFLPKDPKGITGSAGIKAGQYEIPQKEGLPAGDYRVEIDGDADLGFAIDDDVAFANRGKKPLPPPPVPARYNLKSTLTATVRSDTPNEVDFSLTTKDSNE